MKYLVILVKFPLLTWVAYEKDVCYGNISCRGYYLVYPFIAG